MHVDLDAWIEPDLEVVRAQILQSLLDQDQVTDFRAWSRSVEKPMPKAKEQTPREILRDNEWLTLEQAALVWGCGKDKIVEQIGDEKRGRNLGRVGRLGDKLPLRDLNGGSGNKQYRFHRSLFEDVQDDQDEPRKVALAKNLPVGITKRRRAGVA